MTEKEMETAYDAGYTNALMQLRVHILAYVDKPNSQIKKALELIDMMLEVIEDKEL